MHISRIATAFPEDEFSTEELIAHFPCLLPDDVKQNAVNLGVSKRRLLFSHICDPDESPVAFEEAYVALCASACKNAMESEEVSAEQIGCLVATYDASPFLSPGLSQILMRQLDLGLKARNFNLQGAASTAFHQALEFARSWLSCHPDEKVLVCVSGINSFWFQNQVRGLDQVLETRQISKIGDTAGRLVALRKWVAAMQFFLFGDGVAAVILEGGKRGLCVGEIVEVTNVNEADYLAGYAALVPSSEPFRFGFHAHLGREIPEMGVKYADSVLKRLFGEKELTEAKRVRKWAIHTGSRKILTALAEHLSIDGEKLRESHDVLNEYGNLAGASLPVIVERIVSSSGLSEGDAILMLGYGWGFSSAACMLENVGE